MCGLYSQTGQRKYVTREEGVWLLREAKRSSVADYALCSVLLHTGCRISEALALKHDLIDIDMGGLWFRTLKRRCADPVWRLVPVPSDVITALSPLSCTADGKLFAWSRATAWRHVCRLMRQAGMEGAYASPKGLRHRFGVVAVCEGVPISLLQRWMGHAKLENTLIYLQAMGPEERRFADRLRVTI